MPFKDPEVRLLFPVPFITIRLDGSEALNKRLLKEIAKRQRAEPGMTRSNRYGWHSAPDLFQRTEPAHAQLIGELHAMVAACTAKLMPDFPKDLKPIHEGWVNVSPTHAMNSPHDHPGAFWSGTYYVHVPLHRIPPTSSREPSSSSTRAARSEPTPGSTPPSRGASSPSVPRPAHACCGRAS